MEETVVVNRGISTLGVITIVLILLKAFGVINISWFWCFFPILLGPIIVCSILVLVAVCLAIMIIIAAIASLFDK